MQHFAERFAWIVTALNAALGAFGRRIASPPQPVWLGTRCYVPLQAPERHARLPVPLWNLFIRRVQAANRRIQALFAQWRQGTLQPPRPSPPRTRRTPDPAAPRPRRLPRAFGWANARARELAPTAGMLHALLQEDHARAFLADVPRAARLVRPLCQALGVRAPHWLKLPPRPRPPRQAKPRPERPLKLTDPRLGLQPYVIAAACHARKRDRA